MEQRIKGRFNDSVLQETAQRYGIGSEQLRLLDGFESFIYEYERGQQGFILRISHSLRRTEALIEAEVDWINYLAAGGVSAARAIPSDTGRLVEVVEDGQGGCFLATAFVKAKGQSPWRMGWSPQIYKNYGQLVGRMHALAVDYEPSMPGWKRPEWDADLFDFVSNYLPATESRVREKYISLLDYLHTLPKMRSSYGLIHQDAHGSNFFVDEAGVITLFDFDDCAYSWFINDIAIVLFYMVVNEEHAPALTQEFMFHFLEGYRREFQLDPDWLKEIPFFLKLREIELYAVIHRDFDLNNIDHSWSARFMSGRKERIESDIPFIRFDFGSLAHHLGFS